jgi:hypothetical protein
MPASPDCRGLYIALAYRSWVVRGTTSTRQGIVGPKFSYLTATCEATLRLTAGGMRVHQQEVLGAFQFPLKWWGVIDVRPSI